MSYPNFDKGYLQLGKCEMNNNKKLQTFLLGVGEQKYWEDLRTTPPFLNRLTSMKGGQSLILRWQLLEQLH